MVRRFSPAESLGGGRILWIPIGAGAGAKGSKPPWRGRRQPRSPRSELWVAEGAEGSRRRRAGAAARRKARQGRPELANAWPRPASCWPLESGRSKRYLDPKILKKLSEKARTLLKAYFRDNRIAKGMPKAELQSRLLPLRAQDLGATYLGWLQALEVLALDGDLVNLPGRSAVGELTGEESSLAQKVLDYVEGFGLTPPSPAEIADKLHAKPQILEGIQKFLVQQGKLEKARQRLHPFRRRHPAAAAGSRRHRLGTFFGAPVQGPLRPEPQMGDSTSRAPRRHRRHPKWSAKSGRSSAADRADRIGPRRTPAAQPSPSSELERPQQVRQQMRPRLRPRKAGRFIRRSNPQETEARRPQAYAKLPDVPEILDRISVYLPPPQVEQHWRSKRRPTKALERSWAQPRAATVELLKKPERPRDQRCRRLLDRRYRPLARSSWSSSPPDELLIGTRPAPHLVAHRLCGSAREPPALCWRSMASSTNRPSFLRRRTSTSASAGRSSSTPASPRPLAAWRRGGYCSRQNTLFAGALRLGLPAAVDKQPRGEGARPDGSNAVSPRTATTLLATNGRRLPGRRRLRRRRTAPSRARWAAAACRAALEAASPGGAKESPRPPAPPRRQVDGPKPRFRSRARAADRLRRRQPLLSILAHLALRSRVHLAALHPAARLISCGATTSTAYPDRSRRRSAAPRCQPKKPSR